MVDLQIGKEVIGSFEGDLNSDGKEARLKLKSAMSEGAISGEISVGWADPMPVDGKISIQNINLDPYLISALHLKNFPRPRHGRRGHHREGGDQAPRKSGRGQQFHQVGADLWRDELENSGPIHLTSTRDNLKIVSARMKGLNTNIDLSGSVQFTGRRTLAMKLNGTVDLRLLSAYIKDVDIGGHLDANASFEGTLDRPRIIGRMKL